MNRGYVRLWRKTLDKGWIKNHKLWTFWSYCLLKATHQEFDAIVGLQTIHLMPGQFIFGLLVASKETGLTVREIRTILDFLKKAGNLTVKTTNKFSIITIVNWNTYQCAPEQNDTLNDKPLANNWQHTRTREQEKALIIASESSETSKPETRQEPDDDYPFDIEMRPLTLNASVPQMEIPVRPTDVDQYDDNEVRCHHCRYFIKEDPAKSKCTYTTDAGERTLRCSTGSEWKVKRQEVLQ